MENYGKKILVFFAVLLSSLAVSANPVGGQVTSGSASISQTGNTTTINQSSQQAIINWQSFNISAKEKTHFQQPTTGVALNRINPQQGASQIFGTLTATGKIILINGAGIYFGPNSMVNVGSLIVSTSDISNGNFHKGNYVFDRPSQYAGSIVNEGTIRAADYGLVALLGTAVVNNGLIRAEMGSIVLGAGNKFTLSFNGDQLINFSVDEASQTAGVDPRTGRPLANGIKNNGKLLADGGQILVTAHVASGVLDNAIDMRGVAQARSVHQHNGVIILDGGSSGTVLVSGRLNAGTRRHSRGTKGGTIEITGNNIDIASTADINVSGAAGGGNIYIGGNEHGAGPLANASTTTINSGAVLNASALNSGNGGNVIVWSNDNTTFAGTILAKGGALVVMVAS